MLTARKFAILITLIFMACELVIVANHEMWRDELGPWTLAGNCRSLCDLVVYMHDNWEPHPVTWYAALFILDHLTQSPLSMQLLHWAIAGAIVYLVVRYAPLTRLQKTLFPFGYMILYEYAAIARNYSLTVLLVFVTCCLYHLRYRRFLLFSLVIFLLANTNLQGTAIAFAIGLSLFAERILCRDAPSRRIGGPTLLLGYCVILAGCVVSAIQCYSPFYGSHGLTVLTHVKFRMIRALGSVARGLFPLQYPVLQFWDDNVLHSLNPAFNIVLSLLIVFFMVDLLAKNRLLLWIYCLSTVGLVALNYSNLNSCNRHFGYHYIIFIAALWLLDDKSSDRRFPPSWGEIHRFFFARRGLFLSLVLVAQVLCSIVPVTFDILYPFSPSKDAAQWIRATHRENWLIAAYPQYMATGLAGYLSKDVYALEFDEMIADPNRCKLEPLEGRTAVPELLTKVPGLRKTFGSDILFVFSEPIESTLLDRYKLLEVARFDKAITDEKFYIYILGEPYD